jgi:hypothetical protein
VRSLLGRRVRIGACWPVLIAAATRQGAKVSGRAHHRQRWRHCCERCDQPPPSATVFLRSPRNLPVLWRSRVRQPRQRPIHADCAHLLGAGLGRSQCGAHRERETEREKRGRATPGQAAFDWGFRFAVAAQESRLWQRGEPCVAVRHVPGTLGGVGVGRTIALAVLYERRVVVWRQVVHFPVKSLVVTFVAEPEANTGIRLGFAAERPWSTRARARALSCAGATGANENTLSVCA